MAIKLVDNPPNPYISECRQWLEPPPAAKVEVYEENARSIITENESPDIPFTYSVNPYRGCQHACAYCYARPYHEFLDMGAGTDFETKLVVKVNAAKLLAKELGRPKMRGQSLTFSGVTDCYQPLEAVYKVTRACLEVCLDFRTPISIVTKSYLVMRDAHLLASLQRAAGAVVYQSIPYADDKLARAIEPQTPPPSKRFEAMRRLSAAGVPVGVMVSPIIPGLNDQEIPEVLRRAAEAGARSASYIPLRLPGSVAEVFESRLRSALPMRADRVMNRLREMRGNKVNEGRFGYRMKGEGTYWRSIQSLFAVSAARFGLSEVHRDCARQENTQSGSLAQFSAVSQLDSPSRQLRFDF